MTATVLQFKRPIHRCSMIPQRLNYATTMQAPCDPCIKWYAKKLRQVLASRARGKKRRPSGGWVATNR